MKGVRSTVHVEVTMRVKAVLTVIDRRYGSIAKLRAHIDKRPNDTVALLLYDTARRHADEPDLIVHLSEILVGDPAEILAVAKLELLGHVMGRPGVGLRELARSLKKNPATVLEQVAQLERAGLVVKETRGRGKPAIIRPLVTELTIRVSMGAEA